MTHLDERIHRGIEADAAHVPLPDEQLFVEQLSGRMKARRRHRRALSATGAGALALAVLLVVVLVPSPRGRGTTAAAAQLDALAATVRSQPAPTLASDQLLATTWRWSVLAQVNRLASTPTPGAEATIDATTQSWSNDRGGVCLSATSTPARFASPANAAAWHKAGLLDQPADQPATGCFGTDANSQGAGVMDVSKLPRDPETLAHELLTGTTGLLGVDRPAAGGPQSGFERAITLLVGPTTGATPAFDAALYQALSLMPGVTLLGPTTTHTGQTGIGFTGPGESPLGSPVVVVDPHTGALLEARNIPAPEAFLGIEEDYVAPAPTPSPGTEGSSYLVTLRWLDPLSSPSVVAASSLPGGLAMPPTTLLAGTVTANVKPSDSCSQVQGVLDALAHRYHPTGSSGVMCAPAPGAPTPSTPGANPTLEWYFTGSGATVQGYAQSLRASGLFASVVVGPGGSS